MVVQRDGPTAAAAAAAVESHRCLPLPPMVIVEALNAWGEPGEQ